MKVINQTYRVLNFISILLWPFSQMPDTTRRRVLRFIAMVIAVAVFYTFFQEDIYGLCRWYRNETVEVSCLLVSRFVNNISYTFQTSTIDILVSNQTVVSMSSLSNDIHILVVYLIFLLSIRTYRNVYKCRFWRYLLVGFASFVTLRVMIYSVTLLIVSGGFANSVMLSVTEILVLTLEYLAFYYYGMRYSSKYIEYTKRDITSMPVI